MEKLRERILRWMFAKFFKGYDYPFVKSDQLIQALAPAAQKSYFESAHRVFEEPAFKQEIQESIRHFYQELALKKSNTTHESMMQGALLFIKNFQGRLFYLGESAKTPQDPDVINQIE